MTSTEISSRSLWLNYRAARSTDAGARRDGLQMIRVIALAAMDDVVRTTARGMLTVLTRSGDKTLSAPGVEAPCA